jgi:outer membrane receptor for ferrienterochelin and colicin
MNTRRTLQFFLAFSLLLGQARVAFTQSGGKIAGIVKDGKTGSALPGANVMIEGTALGASTDDRGYFMILRVPPGSHTVRAHMMGYGRVSMRNVEVLTDLTTGVDFTLQPETLQGEEIVIVAEKPLVRKDLTSSEFRIQSDRIEKMPVQEIGDILDLQAGITRGTDGMLHIRGGRSSEIAYMVNGISITDDYSRGQALSVENESVQELQVVSGTFNAEYGNAMSGVVNIVTKTGGNAFTGKMEAWTGDYVSRRTDLFWNIDDVDPLAEHNVQATFSGPIVKNRLTFFLTGKRYRNEGWLYGPNAYSPQGRMQTIDGKLVSVKGDSSPVAMNTRNRWSAQGALQWKIMNPLTLKVDFLGSSYDGRWYNHTYRLNPNGMRGVSGYGATAIANLTHVLNRNTFYEVIFSGKSNEERSRLYDDPLNPRYTHPDSLTAGAYKFFKAGTDLYRSFRKTQSLIGKIDFTSQVSRRHQLKTGIEFQRDRIDFENMTLVPATDANGLQITPFRPEILPVSTPNHSLFRREPEKYAVYIQDKIEHENVVINIGLRFDCFKSNGRVPSDPRDPNIYNPLKLSHVYRDLNGDGVIGVSEQTESNRTTEEERKAYWTRPAEAKSQWSPRFGIAYPITDRGVIHFSYGIFQQIPEYSQLYDGDQMKLTEGQGIAGPFGNPDLNPQRTTMYELGIKQQLSDDIGIDVTGYYRDIRDWISTSAPIPTYSAGVTYSKKINRDFADVKGVTFTLTKRLSNRFAFDAGYTFQVVQGTNSSPEDEYLALNAGAEPRKTLAPLEWDQRHTLTLNVFVGTADWGFNAISLFQTGQPYTPEIVSGTLTGQNVLSGLATNSRSKPDRFTVDLNAFRRFKIYGMGLEFFVRVFNLFDAKNPLAIWTDSGRPDYTVYQKQATEADPTWFVRPDFYSEPRRIQLGAKIGF